LILSYVMPPRDNASRPSSRMLHDPMDSVISEALEQDPEEVVHALAEVVNRCKAEGRYTKEEIEAAAAQLRRELGITLDQQGLSS